MKHQIVRDTLVREAEDAFLLLTAQLDHIFDLVSFYLERYPASEGPSHVYRMEDLQQTVNYLAASISQLADVVARWKKGHDRVLSRSGTEISIINELVANANALIFFLEVHHIDLEPFNKPVTEKAVSTIMKCNRLLT